MSWGILLRPCLDTAACIALNPNATGWSEKIVLAYHEEFFPRYSRSRSISFAVILDVIKATAVSNVLGRCAKSGKAS